ncbi:MAG: CDP-alcohol phosphatidyltransferase family protein [Candidatus Heimdallarchaeota archaeon]|nr:CDP-alcohol phosphatidyltransferase family protein [Candidatus Heimdallarchaeota archaeon]
MTEIPTGIFIFKLKMPDLFSFTAFFLGVTSIYLTLNYFIFLSLGILFLAMLFDSLDGWYARKLGLVRQFGVSLDGFIDTVIYLINPIILFFTLSKETSIWLMLSSVIFFLAGIVRLSVFSDVQFIQKDNSPKYLGLPVFWTLHLTGIFLILSYFNISINPLLTSCILVGFSFLFIYNRPWKKFTKPNEFIYPTLFFSLLFSILELM